MAALSFADLLKELPKNRTTIPLWTVLVNKIQKMRRFYRYYKTTDLVKLSYLDKNIELYLI